MRFLGLISTFAAIIFISSCYPGLKGGVRYKDSPYKADVKIMPYDTAPSLNTFDFILSHKGRDVSGLLIIEVSESNNKRVVMTSYFGMTILDFELSEGGRFKLNYSIEQLNRKRILYLFKRDFKILFNPYNVKGVKFLYSSDTLIDALATGRGITALTMKFCNFRDGFPSKIIMDHPALKLSLKLEKTNLTDEPV